MSLFHAFYIRANDKATLAAVRQSCDQHDVEQHRDFIGVKPRKIPKKTPEQMLLRLSETFQTDVFWVSLESAMDCFEFHHWESGQHVRSLVFGMEEERTWERADGTSEPWEKKFLFHPRNMECELEGADEAGDQELKKTIRRVYREAKIEVGQMVPSISSEMTAEAIAHHYGFPHYGLS